MKIITVAAGAGTRLANLSQLNFGLQLPKPLYPVLGKPMVHWSYKSFENWITAGLVKPSDFIFVVRREHDEIFDIRAKIREVTHPNVNFQLLDKLTSGPAESALLAISQIKNDQLTKDSVKVKLGESEAIVINDCDHFFNSSSMLYELSSDNFYKEIDIFLSFTKPRLNNANWSCILTGSKISNRALQVIKIAEKDLSLIGNDKGIVGAYFFATSMLFEDLYHRISTSEGEKYISTLVSKAIEDKLNVVATKAKFGFPLGTESDIEDFENFMLGKSIQELKSSTYFVDIDGVLVEHDPGFHSPEEKYKETQVAISSNIEQLMLQYSKGDRIVLTTARPESQREYLLNFFSSIGFEFDDLIMGLGDGIRFLVNDRKVKDSYMDTAVAINISRNKPYDLINQIPKFMGVGIKTDLTSGSGAYTLKLSDPIKNSVIKKVIYLPSQNVEPAFVLKLQKKWYESVGNIIPNNLPKIYGFTENEDFMTLEMEDISPSYSLNRIINGTGQEHTNQKNLAVNNLVNCLNTLYSKTAKRSENNNSAELEYFIINKSIPGVESLFKSANYVDQNWLKAKSLVINGNVYKNPLESLQFLLNQIQSSKLRKYGLFSKIEANIHGDLTGENILLKPNNEIYLIDPLSTYLRPQSRIKNELSLSHSAISYDFIKILQSFLAGYENWALSSTSTILGANSTISIDESLAINSTDSHIKVILDLYENFGVNISTENMNLLCSLMLFRLIPYRLQINEVSALYCMSLGTLMLERVL